MRVSSKVLSDHLKAFKNLPKRYTIKIECRSVPDKRGKKTILERTKVNYALLTVQLEEIQVVVLYEVLRKFLSSLPPQDVTVEVASAGVRIRHRAGQMFLKHLDGYAGAATLSLDELLVLV